MGCGCSIIYIKIDEISNKKKTLNDNTAAEIIEKETNKLFLNYLTQHINSKRSLVDNKKLDSNSILTLDNKDIKYINDPAINIKIYYKNQKTPSEDVEFIDDLFPPNNSSIYSEDMFDKYTVTDFIKEYVNNYKLIEKDVIWLRARDIFNSQYSVFTNDIAIDDIKQGSTGNCYFMSSISALANNPQLVVQIFKTLTISKNNYYEIALKLDGIWKIILLDDYFPCLKDSRLPIFAKPKGAELWVMLLEKAWAKVNGGYLKITGGTSSEVLNCITPFPIYHINNNKKSKDEIWNNLKNAQNNNYIMTCCSKNNNSISTSGIVSGHGFTVMSIKEGVINGKQVRLLKIRNPWGYKEWSGEWSDNSVQWTEEANRIFGSIIKKDDGIFFIELDDFIKNFDGIDICKVSSPICTKTDKIIKERLNLPNIYEIHILKKSKLNITIIKKIHRFHNKIKSQDLVINIILVKINKKNIEYIASCNECSYNPNLEIELEIGCYLIYIHAIYKYSNYDKIRKLTLYVSNNNYFFMFFRGLDENYSFLQKIIYNRINNTSVKHGNLFENTTYGYYLHSNKTSKIISINVEDESINYEIIHPSNYESFSLSSKSYIIIIGYIKQYYEDFCFRIRLKSSISKIKQDVNQEFNESLITPNQDISIINSNYDFVYKKLNYDYNNIISIIDDKQSAIKYFSEKYPELMKRLLDIPELEDDVIFRDTYTCSHYSYFGEWKIVGNISPHGRGTFKWIDGSEYIGQIINNNFEGFGRFKFPNGEICEINFKNGLMNGKGKYYDLTGRHNEVIYYNGIIV